LRSNDRDIGLFVLSYAQPRLVDETRRRLARLVARHGAVALERACAFDAERAASIRLEQLAAASAKLSSSIDWPQTLRNVAGIFVPEVASACAIDLEVEPDAGRVLRHPHDPSSSARAFPLESRGGRFGTLFLDLPAVAPEDEVLVAELASRAAMALESSRLFRQLEVAVRVRHEFLTIASHELKTPLTTLKMAVSTVQRFGAVPDRSAALAMRQVNRLESLVEQLLDVTRISAGRLALELAEVDLSALAREALELVPGSSVDIDAPVPVMGRWDRFRLHQVLVNLLTNAVKYGREEPIRVTVSRSRDRAAVRVIDRGIGIEESARDRIFDRYERAVSSRNFSGFGLGLWISREIVEAHGGSIRVDSEVGRGSEFIVELPLAP
jgi:signal transduction histidine kinase